MGFWDIFKKKVDPQQEIQDLFLEFGVNGFENNTATSGGASRKETIKRIQAEQQAIQKKENLVEKLKELNKYVTANTAFTDVSNTLYELTRKLVGVPDNDDKLAMLSVDNFILLAINNAYNYCNRDNWVGLNASMSIIEELINDRFSCGEWYKNADYIKARSNANIVYVEMKDLESRIISKKKRAAELKEKYEDPAFKSNKQAIARELEILSKDVESDTNRINNLTKEYTLFKQIVNTLEQSVSDSIKNDRYDLHEEIGKILELKREDTARMDAINSCMDKMNRIEVKPTEEDISVSSTIPNNLGITEEEPQFDIGKLDNLFD